MTPAPGSVMSAVRGPAVETPDAERVTLIRAQDMLAHRELAYSVGSHLLTHWLERALTRTHLPYDNSPLNHFCMLVERYHAADRQLERLAPVDQLFCRAIYAAAAPIYLPERVNGGSRRSAALQLRHDAEQLADGLAIWRKPDLAHIAPLLTLYKLNNSEDFRDEGALPYLAAAISQCRQLDSRRPKGAIGPGAAISWTLVLMDVFGAVGRAQRPHLAREEIAQFFVSNGSAQRLDRANLRSIGGDLETSKAAVTSGFATLVLIGYHTAVMAASSENFRREALEALWTRLDDLQRWCRETAYFADARDPDMRRVYWYGTVVWATSVAIEYSLVSLVGTVLARTARLPGGESSPYFGELVVLSALAQRRVETQLCAYLPRTYDDLEADWLNTLAFLPGVTCSVTSILDMTQMLAHTSVADQTLFPHGARDRLKMFDHVFPQIRNLGKGYPSTKLDRTLEMMEAEQRHMQGVILADVGGGADLVDSSPRRIIAPAENASVLPPQASAPLSFGLGEQSVPQAGPSQDPRTCLQWPAF